VASPSARAILRVASRRVASRRVASRSLALPDSQPRRIRSRIYIYPGRVPDVPLAPCCPLPPPPLSPRDRGVWMLRLSSVSRARPEIYLSFSLSLSLSLARYTPRNLSLFSELSSLFPTISPGNFIILSVPLLHSAISISVNLGLLSGRPL